MDDAVRHRLQHKATVPKSLRDDPPLLLAVQLAGAGLCASLSHAVFDRTPADISPLKTPQACVVDLAKHALAAPLQRAMAAHYGLHALARGRQKPLGPCFRSLQDRQRGSHSGRNRALWRQSKRAPCRRHWCARCGLPRRDGDGDTSERNLHLPCSTRSRSRVARQQHHSVSSSSTRSAQACVHCLEVAQLQTQSLPASVEMRQRAIHCALRGIASTAGRRHHRRAPRKHKARRAARTGTTRAAAAATAAKTTAQVRRLAAAATSVAPLTPSSAAVLTRPRAAKANAGAAVAAGNVAVALPSAADEPRKQSASLGPSRSAKAAVTSDDANSAMKLQAPAPAPNTRKAASSAVAVTAASQHMAQLARAVPKGPVTAMRTPSTTAPRQPPTPQVTGRVEVADAHQQGQARAGTGASQTVHVAAVTKPTAVVPTGKRPAKKAPAAAALAKATGKSQKVLDAMKSLGF